MLFARRCAIIQTKLSVKELHYEIFGNALCTPRPGRVKQQFADLLARFKAAATYAEAHAVFLEEEKLNKHVDTLAQLASVRNTIDTRDKFYDEEMNFWNEATPQLQECQNAWSRAMLDSPFRADFTAEYGDLMFVNAEIADKAFSPDILDEMAQENKLTTEYGKLIASAQIPFEGGVYTLTPAVPVQERPRRCPPSGRLEGRGRMVQRARGRV